MLSGMRCHVSGKFKDISKEDDDPVLRIEIPQMIYRRGYNCVGYKEGKMNLHVTIGFGKVALLLIQSVNSAFSCSPKFVSSYRQQDVSSYKTLIFTSIVLSTSDLTTSIQHSSNRK